MSQRTPRSFAIALAVVAQMLAVLMLTTYVVCVQIDQTARLE